MINYQELGIDPVEVTQQLGMHIELPQKVPLKARAEAMRAASVRRLYPYAIALFPFFRERNFLGGELDDEAAVLSYEQQVLGIRQQIEKLDPSDKVNKKTAAQLVGNLTLSLIHTLSRQPVSYCNIRKASDEPITIRYGREGNRVKVIEREPPTPAGLFALGVLGLHELDIKPLNGERPFVEQVMQNDPTAREEYPIFMHLLEPYVDLVAQKVG